jgi:DNA-binding transcriptional regulator WhiA
LPHHSGDLAELFGILAGDGHVGAYQISMTTNALTDIEHALYVQKLFDRLFHASSHITKRKTANAVVVVLSSRKVSEFLCKHGLVRGNKVHKQLAIPEWIQKNSKYSIACVRGLFDTDGSVYVDAHTIRGKKYFNIGLAFTNRSIPLLTFFKETLEKMGFHPTKKTKDVVFLRREAEIIRYFDLVGSSNQKHLNKFHAYRIKKEEYQRGRTGPHSKCG